MYRSTSGLLFVSAAIALGWSSLLVARGGQIAVRNQGFVPFSDAPIHYRTAPVADPVALLQQDLATGRRALAHDPVFGYLPAVLDHLAIPRSTQMLVFSKTSFQFRNVSPEVPRALYFNDDVYVGFVHGGKALELISFDAVQGAMFYLLEQRQVERPAFQRAELDCTQCHIAASTRSVPGVFVRSVFTTPRGTLSIGARSFVTGHESPLSERFGGWYVTGTHGDERHLGNATVADRSEPERLDRDAAANLRHLARFIDPASHLTPHSDIVAQLVHAHQTQMHNLITLTNYRTRLALHAAGLLERSSELTDTELPADVRKRIEGPAEELVRYLLFADEAPLTAAVSGTSGFAEGFAARGVRDTQGRSLRDFDLRTRLFKYPCSYLVYSAAFDSLPGPARRYVQRRLFEVLSGRDRDPAFARLTDDDRRAVRDILTDTKPELASAWKQLETSAR